MFGLIKATLEALVKGEKLQPQISTSTKYKHWVSVEDLLRCVICGENHGKIWLISETPDPNPPIHENCRCKIEPMKVITAGTATTDGINGADWKIKYESELPEYYVDKSSAIQAGWKPGKWPSNFIPEKMISCGIYNNDDKH